MYFSLCHLLFLKVQVNEMTWQFSTGKKVIAKVLRLKPVILGSHKALPALSAGCSHSSLTHLQLCRSRKWLPLQTQLLKDKIVELVHSVG